jgi:hypothetical protein
MRYTSFQYKVLLVLLECGVLLLLTGFKSFDHLLRIQLRVRLFLTGLKSFDHLLRMRLLVLLSRTGLKSLDHLSVLQSHCVYNSVTVHEEWEHRQPRMHFAFMYFRDTTMSRTVESRLQLSTQSRWGGVWMRAIQGGFKCS